MKRMTMRMGGLPFCCGRFAGPLACSTMDEVGKKVNLAVVQPGDHVTGVLTEGFAIRVESPKRVSILEAARCGLASARPTRLGASHRKNQTPSTLKHQTNRNKSRI